jgi:Tol biopolymer transport system component/DNA-binding winged helix-turn-helix (wHTH) protein
MSVAPTNLFQGPPDRLSQPNLLLRVGEHILDVGTLRLTTRPEYPRLTSKAVAVLLQLVRHRGATVTRDELLDRVWADRVTTQDVLTQAIKELRRAFCDDAKPPRYIETIPKVGYRLLAEVDLLDHDDGARPERMFAPPAVNDPYISPPAAVYAAAAPVPTKRRWPWRSLGTLALLFGVAAIAFFVRSVPVPADVNRWQVGDVRSLTSDPGSEDRPRISPDGTRVAYSKTDTQLHVSRILMRALGQTQSLAWQSDAKANEDTPMWSPDGSSIVFERVSDSACELVVTSNLGVGSHVVGNCQNPLTNYYDWSPDGSKLITAERSERSKGHLALMHWDLASGEKLPLEYPRPPEEEDLNAHYSPDGHWIAFRRGLAPYSDLWVMTADGHNARQLTHLRSSIRGYTWSRDSSALILSSNHEGRFGLYAIDVRSGAIQPLQVSPAEFPDAARHDDTVVYEIPRVQYKLTEMQLGSAQSPAVHALAPSTGSEMQPVFSPSDERMAFVSDRSGAQQLWLYDNADGATISLTDFHDSLLSNPNWSADGSKLLITVRKPDQAQLFEIDVASRRRRLLSKPGDDVQSAGYGAEPGSILLTLGVPGKDNQLLLVEHAGAAEERRHPLVSGIWYSEFDAGTHQLYYSKNARYGVFVRTLSAGGELTPAVLVAPELMDHWHIVDGRIWYCTPSRQMSKGTELRELNPADGSERALANIDAEVRDMNFSAAPKRDRIAYVTVISEDTDIGALRLTRIP